MDEVLTSTLQDAVLGRLDDLDTIASDGDERSKAALADSEIIRLTGAWRELLAEHRPDERGRCRACASTPPRRRLRCTVWAAAYRHLIGDPAERRGTASAGRHCLRKPRPATT
ncbi:hypothetical protein [Amycolatopsis samaneae]|uniref:DUF222 domain-containing protein n=1 Tax=Amycolatopsis samaneae TaxID=664691 RepID=A0ABW5GTP7_9PSEU